MLPWLYLLLLTNTTTTNTTVPTDRIFRTSSFSFYLQSHPQLVFVLPHHAHIHLHVKRECMQLKGNSFNHPHLPHPICFFKCTLSSLTSHFLLLPPFHQLMLYGFGLCLDSKWFRYRIIIPCGVFGISSSFEDQKHINHYLRFHTKRNSLIRSHSNKKSPVYYSRYGSLLYYSLLVIQEFLLKRFSSSTLHPRGILKSGF